MRLGTDGRLAIALLVALPWAGAAQQPTVQHVPRAPEPTLQQVLGRAADYTTRLHSQLAGIVAEEHYVQEVRPTPKAGIVTAPDRRDLRADLLLVRRPGESRYVEFRDVFEVDGAAVRERADRLTALFLDPTFADTQRLKRIIDESARHNLGALFRNINTPMLALSFLEPAVQPRFRFRRARGAGRDVAMPTFETPGSEPGASRFRVSTEMWSVEFTETRRPTLIRTNDGRDFPASGRLWLNPETGALLMSEIAMKNRIVDAHIVVSYESEPLLGFLVPIGMQERYRSSRESVDATATYGRFRQFQVTTSEAIGKPPGR